MDEVDDDDVEAFNEAAAVLAAFFERFRWEEDDDENDLDEQNLAE